MHARYLAYALGLLLWTSPALAQDTGTSGAEPPPSSSETTDDGSATDDAADDNAADDNAADDNAADDNAADGNALDPARSTTAEEDARSTPPPPETAPVSSTTPPPEEEEDGDGRDADIFWLEAGFGYSYADLVSFSQENFIPVAEQLSGNGFMGTFAVGFRIAILTLGARASLAKFADFDLGQVVFDASLRLPTPLIEPFVRVGIGYGWVGSADITDPANSDTTVFGLVGEVGAGLDIYLSDFFSVGAGFDAVFLNLTRQRVDEGCGVGGSDCMIDDINFEEDGDAVGLQIRVNGHAGLHF